MAKDSYKYQMDLKVFYSRECISVNSFSCPHQVSCDQAALPRLLTHGAEAHVGSRYGEINRVLVVSLDSRGDSLNLDDRRRQIESIATPENPHMWGTLRTLQALMGPEPNGMSPFVFFAMINAAKCSGSDKKGDMVPIVLYERCRAFARTEIEVLEPEVIVTQGLQARAAVNSKQRLPAFRLDTVLARLTGADPMLKTWLQALANEYLRILTIASQDVIVLDTPHPSARGGQWQRFDRLCLDTVSWIIRELLVEVEDSLKGG